MEVDKVTLSDIQVITKVSSACFTDIRKVYVDIARPFSTSFSNTEMFPYVLHYIQ